MNREPNIPSKKLIANVQERCTCALAGSGLVSQDQTAITMGVEAMLSRYARDHNLRRDDVLDRALGSDVIDNAVAAACALDGSSGSWWQVRNARFSAAYRYDVSGEF